MPPDDSPRAAVRGYHARTKHHPGRYAAGPGRLDWASQPDPFRHFTGAPRLRLPLHEAMGGPRYDDLYRPGAVAPQPLTLDTLGCFFEFSLGLAAWKQYSGSRWALRCNPSSGNLHPTEGYAVLVGVPGIEDGVYHYLSLEHVLEQRCALAPTSTRRHEPAWLPPGFFLVGLTSIFWREAWKYGERAWRYCALDLGHALAALRYAAAALGWRVRLLAEVADETLAVLLGLDRTQDFEGAERESPEALLGVWTAPAAEEPSMIDCQGLASTAAGKGRWQGRANRLSPYHAHEWRAIETVARATRKPATHENLSAGILPTLEPSTLACRCATKPLAASNPAAAPNAFLLFRQRRSALGYDARTPLERETFLRMLELGLPCRRCRGRPPWDLLPSSSVARIHLVLFVHRVSGLAPGLYLLARRSQAEGELRQAISPVFRFEPAATLGDSHRLWRLQPGDWRATAQLIACHQAIAADGAFSLGMLAEFEAALSEGPWAYRRLFWEAGLLGQLFYLEAEAAGHRGTGIGCFFDDVMHEQLGLKDERFQSVYHFSLGRPVDDPRLVTLAPYAQLSGARDGGEPRTGSRQRETQE